MKKIQTLFPILFLILFSAESSADELWGGSFSKLKSRIIRSVTVSPHNQKKIIAGNKGSAAGDAKLFASDNGGVSWRFLNNGKSLTSNATDVQAVAVVSPTVILAGTWKHGLFRSDDSGESFNQVNGIRNAVQSDVFGMFNNVGRVYNTAFQTEEDRFTVNVNVSGSYRILGRVNSDTGADDSFWVRVDEGTWHNWNDWNTATVWEWLPIQDNDNGNTLIRWSLDAGSHTIDFAYREDGARIDKLHLTINGTTPEGEGEESINCGRRITYNLFIPALLLNR